MAVVDVCRSIKDGDLECCTAMIALSSYSVDTKSDGKAYVKLKQRRKGERGY